MKKVLIVDDDNGGGISFLIEDLKYYGFNAAFINDAGRVTDLLKKDEIHAIILDIIMPVPESWPLDLRKRCNDGMETGIILYEIIRNEYPSIPIIFHTIRTTNIIKNDRFTYTISKLELHEVVVEKLNELVSMSS
jgi:CheY-like chemotaxis protein